MVTVSQDRSLELPYISWQEIHNLLISALKPDVISSHWNGLQSAMYQIGTLAYLSYFTCSNVTVSVSQWHRVYSIQIQITFSF